MNITKLPEGVTMRSCPGCGYINSQLSVSAARIDNPCPQCRKYMMSEFIPYQFTPIKSRHKKPPTRNP